MTDRVGSQLGAYRLVQLLGTGGFAEVYLGEHLYLGTQAAIKVLSTALTPKEHQQFLAEAQTVAKLEHPHIVRVLDFGMDQATPYLVLQYAPGGTLREVYPAGVRVPLPTLLVYVRQIAEALDYAHQQRFVHRDIKPQNLLIGKQGEILLSDFGIAVIAQSTTHLSTQQYAGTAAYSAPEQFQGKPRPASDQYALAVVVYHWLCGRLPFTGPGYLEFGYQHVHEPPPPLRQFASSLPPAVEQVILKALAKDPHQRYPTVMTFAQALEQASQRTASHITSPAPGTPGTGIPFASGGIPSATYQGPIPMPVRWSTPPGAPMVPPGNQMPPSPSGMRYPPGPAGGSIVPVRAVAPPPPKLPPTKLPSVLPLLRGRLQLRDLLWLSSYSLLLWVAALPGVFLGTFVVHTQAQGTPPGEGYNILLLLFGLPLWSLLSGACLGSWRGLVVTLLGLGGGLLLLNSLYHVPATADLQYVGLPVAALITGVQAERRHFSGWIKACWAFLPGTLIFALSVDLTSRDPTSIQNIAGGAIYCVVLLLFAASLEVILQALARRLQKRKQEMPPQP